MFVYEKKLEYPVRIRNANPALAKFICSQYGGPDGELGASLRYLSQRYAMPYPELSAILTDIGTEELGHLEMVGTIVYQLTRSMTPEQIKQFPVHFKGKRFNLVSVCGCFIRKQIRFFLFMPHHHILHWIEGNKLFRKYRKPE